MKRLIFCLIAIATITVLLLTSGQSFAGKILFDDFSGNYIDGAKWRQRTYVREIVNGQFVSKLGNRSPGMDAEVAPGVFRNNLGFKNPDSINSIECEITIVETELDSAINSCSLARVAGYFYNINDVGGATGDIFAHVMIGDWGNGGLEAYWEVQEMLSDDTRTWQVIGSGRVIGPGTLGYNNAYKVKITYDGDRTFSFLVDGQSTSPFVGPERKRSAVSSFKALSTGINATNGSNNGFVFAKFDNVYVNGLTALYDDFSSALIDADKWVNSEWVREASEGNLRANIIGNESTSTVNTHLAEKDAPYFEAKVRIDSSSQLSQGAYGVGRIQGFYYNDCRGPGSGQDYIGYEGDVLVQVRLRYNSDGTLSANAYVDRSNDENQSSFTNLFSCSFSVPIELDTYYALSIRFGGKKLIFGCAGETAEYNITSSIYPPYAEHRLLRSRVYLDPGETGYIKVRFDDVYIEKKGKFVPLVPLLLLDE